jgi:hypothetical protein
MRFADSLCGGVDTILEHRAVLDRHNAVWIAKMGKPLAGQKITELREQIRGGTATYVFLVQRVGGGYQWTRCRLVDIAKSLPHDERKLVPAYYHDNNVVGQAATWFKLTGIQKAHTRDVVKLRVLSSGRPIAETLKSSMAAMFVVTSSHLPPPSVDRMPRFKDKPSLENAVLDAFEDDEE